MSDYSKRNRNQPIGLNPDVDTYARQADGRTDLERRGGPGPHSVLAPRRRGGAVATGVSAVNFLAGIWLVLAPFVLDYPVAGPGATARWNDIVIGGVVALVALFRMVAPDRTGGLGFVNVLPGLWLATAPFVFGYEGPAMWNDVLVGVVVVVVALLSGGPTLRRWPKREPAAGPEQTR
jgi:SPW repeat